jgi:hypothetical protein
MVQNHAATTGQTIASLVGEIVGDVRELLKQEAALVRRGVCQQLHKAKQAMVLLWLGIGSAVLGGLLLVFMLVYLLHAVLSESMPLWSCFGIVGAALTILGSGLFFLGKWRARDVQVMPEQTVAMFVEALQQSLDGMGRAMKDTFQNSVGRPVQQRPWTMLAGSLAAGYMLSQLVSRRRPASREAEQTSAEALPNWQAESWPDLPPGGKGSARGAEPRVPTRTLLGKLTKTFAPEIQELKALAISTMMGLVRDALKRSVTPPLSSELEKVVDRVTTKLGGVPLAEVQSGLPAERVCAANGTATSPANEKSG